MTEKNKNLENGIIKSIPKKWTKDEETHLLKLKEDWLNNKEISNILWRTEVSISVKYKRIHKKDNTYNKKHVLEKYKTNDDFFNYIKPDTLLDVYAWNKYYEKYNLKKYITNDKDKEKNTDYHLEAFEFLSMFYNKSFDLVDLDPFGSAFDCFDLWIKIAKKWLIITLGEIWHKRFNRFDFVKDRYWINSKEQDWEDMIVEYIKNRWLIYKKRLKVKYLKKFNNISRVYFEVEKFKETSQWEK